MSWKRILGGAAVGAVALTGAAFVFPIPVIATAWFMLPLTAAKLAAGGGALAGAMGASAAGGVPTAKDSARENVLQREYGNEQTAVALESKIHRLEEIIEPLADQNERLVDENERLTEETERLADENERLTDENERLKLEVVRPTGEDRFEPAEA